ncbi:MAG: 1-acyl-sn-glycerol-3-phosphate acyltransferase [Butyrivibrio sp.]|nr:1-acyl-sn-glycerol-3-phosphate acyltransferase [Butyrivibrio sp.]
MSNYYRTILKNLHRIIYYVIKVRIWMRHPERHSEEERYAVAREMVEKMNRSSGYKTIAYGLENLPKEGGYVLYPNHQGKYDVPGIFATHDKPLSFIMDEKRSHIILVNEFLELVDGKRLILNDPRQAITIFMEIAEEIKKGRKYVLFPEGGYKENNQNVVEDFKPGSFKLAQMAKCPIVPVALIDSYKVFNSDHVGPVTTYAYYMEPIPYEDFKSMKTKDIAKQVENQIREKIKEHLGS